MKKKYFILVLFFFTGCFPFSAHDERLVGKFSLSATDIDSDMSLCYGVSSGGRIGIVDATVFAVGFNNDYVIAKQHPKGQRDEPDKSITNYYIVPIKMDTTIFVVKDNVIGPLTEEEFVAKRKELDIPDDLTFTKVFKDLE